jgi:hypothetical protein
MTFRVAVASTGLDQEEKMRNEMLCEAETLDKIRITSSSRLECRKGNCSLRNSEKKGIGVRSSLFITK